MKDQRGNEIIEGNPYLFTFGAPGPDVTLVIATGFSKDKVICCDLYFKFELEISPARLYQRYKYPWSDGEILKVREFGGNFKMMEEHNRSINNG